MSKVTKKERIKELERQVRGLTVLFSSLNTWSEYADNMLTELNHALPDPEYDAKCEAAVAGVDTSKEPLEVDLSSELTGSELCRAMLERGDKYVMCLVFDDTRNLDATYVIRGYHDGYFHTTRNPWENAIPINNQGEPLTAAEAGL